MKCLPRHLRILGRSVGTRNKSAIARQSLRDAGIREKILGCIGKELQCELTQMCKAHLFFVPFQIISLKASTTFSHISTADLENFTCDILCDELNTSFLMHAPQ